MDGRWMIHSTKKLRCEFLENLIENGLILASY